MKFPKCLLCENGAVDSICFESGNNAEIPVDVDLCQEHLEEQEKTDYAFEQKYAYEILQAAYQAIGFI